MAPLPLEGGYKIVTEAVLIEHIKAGPRFIWTTPGPDDIKDMAASIGEKGIRYPILIDEDNNLIDGLIRMQAVRSLGRVMIPAIRVATYDEAMEYLTKIHRRRAAPPLRTYEIFTSLSTMYRRRHRSNQSAAIKALNAGTPKAAPPNPRAEFASSVGMLSLGHLEALISVARAQEDPNPARAEIAHQMLAGIASGELTPYSASGSLVRWDQEQNKIHKPGAQRTILGRAAEQMRGLNGALSALGRIDPDVPVEEAQAWHAEMYAFRAQLTRVLRRIQERIDGDK